MIELDGPVAVPLAALASWNPLLSPPWAGAQRLTVALVENCLARNILRSEAMEDGRPSALMHAARIAWFVRHAWDTPIAIDVGVPELGCHVAWPIVDGNHRLAAAFLLELDTIQGEISGSLPYATSLFDRPRDAPAPARMRVQR